MILSAGAIASDRMVLFIPPLFVNRLPTEIHKLRSLRSPHRATHRSDTQFDDPAHHSESQRGVPEGDRRARAHPCWPWRPWVHQTMAGRVGRHVTEALSRDRRSAC